MRLRYAYMTYKAGTILGMGGGAGGRVRGGRQHIHMVHFIQINTLNESGERSGSEVKAMK